MATWITEYVLFLFTFVLFSGTTFGQILNFDETKFELGDIDDLTPVSRDVHYKNTGDKLLTIERVKTSCGCTTSKLGKKELQPNESGTLTVTFNPAGKKGKQLKKITFFSNDIGEKSKAISIATNIIPVIGLKPRRIEFKLDQSGKGYDKGEDKFVIENLGKETIAIEDIQCGNENFIVPDLKNSKIEEGGKLEVSVGVNPEFVPNRYTSVNIKVDMKIGDKTATRSVRLVVRPLQVSRK